MYTIIYTHLLEIFPFSKAGNKWTKICSITQRPQYVQL